MFHSGKHSDQQNSGPEASQSVQITWDDPTGRYINQIANTIYNSVENELKKLMHSCNFGNNFNLSYKKKHAWFYIIGVNTCITSLILRTYKVCDIS